MVTIAAISDLGLTFHCDPARLNPTGEFFAVMAKMPTMKLFGGEMIVRDQYHLATPIKPGDQVHSLHTCGTTTVSYTHLRAHET